MKEEPADVKVEPGEEIPDDLKRIKEEKDILQDANDMEFFFESIECLSAVENQSEKPRGDAEKRMIDAQVAVAWRLLEETSYLSDPEYNGPASPHGVMHEQEEDRRPIHIRAAAANAPPNNELDFLGPSSDADILRGSSNTRHCLEEQKLFCPVCGNVSRSSVLFMEHTETHEKNQLLACHTCNAYFSTENALKKRTVLHKSDKQTQSHISDLLEKQDEDVLVSEINSITKYGPSKSVTQNIEMKEQAQRNRERDNTKAFRRESEGLSSSETENRTTKQATYFVRNICNEFATESYVKAHLRMHVEEMRFCCNICGKQFKRSKSLKQHQRVQTGAKPFECKVCGKRFARRYSLICHTRTHTGEKPFKCNVCGKAFTHSSRLNDHSLNHNDEKPFVCSVCGKTFKRRQNLKTHSRIHTGDKPFKCNVCGKAFTQSSILNEHSRIHSDERPFVCSVCGKTFKWSQTLKTHSRIHTGDKPFKCNVCGKAFNQSSSLNEHSHIHSNERPFVCSVCGKTFKRRQTLKTHSRIHTGDKPFNCNMCDEEFTQKCYLYDHIRTHSA